MLLAANEGPNQATRTRRLILAFDVRICPADSFLHGVAYMYGYKDQDAKQY